MTRSMANREKFFDLSLDLLCIANFEGYFVDVNAAFTRVLGHSREELLSRPYLSFIHPDDVPATARENERVETGTQTPLHFENRYRHKEGHYITLSWSSVTDHEAGRVYGVARDTTAQAEVRARLARTIDILNETNAIAKVGGWELDVKTGELEWTDETFRILEVEKRADRKPMLPQGLKLFTEECQPVIERAVSRAIEFGEPYSLELEARTAKGNVLWVYTNGKANYEDGEVVSLSGTIQDIHARKTAELRYEAERRRGIHAAKLASLGQLAAAMAHELNNPLGIVSGYAEVVLTTPGLPEAAKQDLEGILKSCDRMAHIVRNLKRFSRSGEEPHAPHALRGIIEESLLLVSPQLKRERVRVDFDSDSDARVSCAEIEIEQVLVNLLNNAIDAVRSLDDRWISIELIERGKQIDLLITDAGEGIDDAHLEELFSAFHTTKDEGTGLGLAICRGILEDHGATLSYERGSLHTCFKLVFPRAGGDAHDD